MLNLIIQATNAILSIINSLGYFGIFLGMTIESSFFPFPSEVILIPAGALISQGQMSFMPVIIAGILGSLAGALINYYLAFFLGRKTIDFLVKKYGCVLFLNQEKLKNTDKYFYEHGEITTFVGRLIPVIRQLISIPAGFSKMNLFRFSIFTTAGAGIWAVILIFLGYLLGENSNWIQSNLKYISITITLISAIIILLYIIYKKKKNYNKQNLKN